MTIAIPVEKVIENFKEIIAEVDSTRAKNNWSNWKMGVHNIPGVRKGNYVFSNFVNAELNPWANWETMPESLKLLVIMSDSKHIFTNEV
jgi:hypothetical protein